MPPKRKRSNDADDDERDGGSNKQYAYLKPRVRHISERTIKAKWTTLPEPVQQKVLDMFRSLERPVIVRQRDERKRIEAQTAVGALVRNLGRRLPRMPFPPITKDTNFDYESAIDEHRSLEAHLATVNSSIDLLQAEIDKEEALLAKETKQLEEMEKNAKAAESERKRQMKNEHPVLRQLDNIPNGNDEGWSNFVIPEIKGREVALCDLQPDSEVAGLLKQLNGHLQSMHNNVAPLDGLKEAITRSQAALNLLPIPAD
ncbi:CENP-Q, a CENPA-CAD centromere complex subunit-domain-containing protein [Paecilomyces variotii]|uniref:CENP-Q, a CENPA-CAD centromere complex subunit-domain-containing protein n=1 Tax=Byssochlamys spectabilis TaxID=264951 RepID=A0A443I226_BYSSP|nr:CENP-Q, a CENPA-CAD centromere complex subunit-domain-containing protein [Paecilomyces variotii]KAJ9245390.1 hypothetical protein DTO169E5_695 [Paecilomyces variotii]KAJ9252435.1 hypothetical protein DTO207G8_4776 [Paecilomyces variotii]KAJ9254067.1 hypothetical protein DTO195F2_6823 [Paecilomyces variotii]KAJ9364317.1 hypothetical protein DTO280E4_1563 [Paecilomyces variotii]KAJ9374166.1 hypothetical protein DTO282E5_1088 [Paecilomyces variotii]